MSNKMSPLDMLNRIREKAKLEENTDFSKSIAIKLKAGKIKFQLLAKNQEYLFKPRVQHMIPTIPYEDDKNEKWLVADCKKDDKCPICIAVNTFKHSGVSVEDVNEAYKPKYPYKNLKSVFTQPEHYLLCAKVLSDQADEGSYLPKDSEIGSTHLIQFTRTALNNLMAAYEDFIEDNGTEDDTPSLFAIFDGDDTASSLVITCRVTNQPYSCSFSFSKESKVDINDVDKDKLELLETTKEVPEDHYIKCVNRIKNIQNYFVKSSENLATSIDSSYSDNKKSSADEDDEFNLDDLIG